MDVPARIAGFKTRIRLHFARSETHQIAFVPLFSPLSTRSLISSHYSLLGMANFTVAAATLLWQSIFRNANWTDASRVCSADAKGQLDL